MLTRDLEAREADSRSSTIATKADRIALRLSREQHELLTEASRAERTTLSAFVLDASLQRAKDALADRRRFQLPDPQWDAFVAMLDRPVQDRPDLRALLSRRTVFDRGDRD